MKQPLKKTIEFFATTELEANSLVTEMKQKHSSSIVNEQIARKVKRKSGDELEYFLVKVTIQHTTARDLLEDLI